MTSLYTKILYDEFLNKQARKLVCSLFNQLILGIQITVYIAFRARNRR